MLFTRRNFLKAAGVGAALAGYTYAYHSCKRYPARKALLIGVDGLRADSLALVPTPNIDSLIHAGAYSFEAQAIDETWSAPGWNTILTGVFPKKHGVKDNSFSGKNNEQYPTIFSRLAQGKTGSAVAWNPLEELIGKGENHNYYSYNDRKVVRRTEAFLYSGVFDFIFTHFISVDNAGHLHGFSDAVLEYAAAIEEIDGYVGKLVDAIRNRQTYSEEEWLVMLVSDHGGRGKGHGGTSPEEKTIPYIVEGLTVEPGRIVVPPLQVDVVPTVLTHLGVPIKPEWGLDGKVVGLK